jgi:hypothetical protein
MYDNLWMVWTLLTLDWLWDGVRFRENIKQAKGNECSQYKCAAAIFWSSLPIFPIHIFSSGTQACFALVTSYNTACFVLVTSHNLLNYMLHSPLSLSVFTTRRIWTQNMPRHDKVKINRANGQTGGKNLSTTFVLTAFISFDLFNIFPDFGPLQFLCYFIWGFFFNF